MTDALFGAPAGWLLDVWPPLPSSLSSIGWLAVVLYTWGFARNEWRARRQARWPDGKP